MDSDTLTAFTILNFVTMIVMTLFLIHYTTQVKGYNKFLMLYVRRLVNVEVDVTKLLIKQMEQSLKDVELGEKYTDIRYNDMVSSDKELSVKESSIKESSIKDSSMKESSNKELTTVVDLESKQSPALTAMEDTEPRVRKGSNDVEYFV